MIKEKLIHKPKLSSETHKEKMDKRRAEQQGRKVTYRKIQTSAFVPREEDRKHAGWRDSLRRIASSLKGLVA